MQKGTESKQVILRCERQERNKWRETALIKVLNLCVHHFHMGITPTHAVLQFADFYSNNSLCNVIKSCGNYAHIWFTYTYAVY